MNYKPYSVSLVGSSIRHSVYRLDVKRLINHVDNGSLTESYHLDFGTTSYQVPTGRKFVVLEWLLSHSSGSAVTVKLYSAVTDNSTVGATLINEFHHPAIKGTDIISIEQVIPAGSYVVIVSGGTTIHYSAVIGYEVDV